MVASARGVGRSWTTAVVTAPTMARNVTAAYSLRRREHAERLSAAKSPNDLMGQPAGHEGPRRTVSCATFCAPGIRIRSRARALFAARDLTQKR